jgi:hypothetical protein
VLAGTNGDVTSFVDELLELCPAQGLQLRSHDGGYALRVSDEGQWEALDLPLPLSAFRAMLARIAFLCDQRRANSVSPYGGTGEISVANGVVHRLTFVNTPGEQKLEIAPLP